jgi:hypothetical protein
MTALLTHRLPAEAGVRLEPPDDHADGGEDEHRD